MTEETKDGYASLYVAIQEGNIEAAELLIKCGTNVNDHYERNRTPLHIAIGRKQLEIAKLLIKNGANVNAKTQNHGKDDLTPMHFAVFANTPEFIELLASHGALINERESTEGYTPLHFAALYGNKNIIQALIDKGQDIEDVDNNGRTALFLAARQCTEAEDDSRIEIIKYLIDKLKADVTKKDNNNNAVLFPAANNCPGKVVEFIIEQYIKIFELENFINHKNNDGMDALVRQEVLGEQLVKIQHKQSLANSLEQTTMLHEVTSVIELVGWTMQGTTEVKEWSPEIPEDIEVDMFMAMEDSMKDNVKASYHSLYRDLRPCHVLKWTSSELGRSHAFLLRYVGTSQQRQELAEDAGEVGLIDSTQNVGKPRTRGSDQQYSNWNRDCYANTTEVGITCDIN